ncbi:DUF1203 domain-containing protein [Roseibium sp. MMSF_3412]|uniref:DUF1203 domain-containing protein n=1 Tax=Roseibium sp. MMSF_3412 TaxID=3046712 RepID=UPI00273F19C3|nr:DUF1203 domain-containing protein [Roseibium sp. MMSF_3412]
MFQINPLPENAFSHLYGLSDEDLARQNVQVHVSDGGAPCRVSLTDLAEGQRVFLLNFEHQPGKSPYRSRHAIYVGDGALENHPAPDAVPASISSRLLSVRAFNAAHEIIDADVIDGHEVAGLISNFFSNPDVDYLHLHFAKRGCFAAKVTRADG